MLNQIGRLRGLAAKLGGALRLARADPEAFGRNLMQFTHQAAFEARLVDVLHASPMHVQDAPAGSAPRLNVLDTNWTRSGMTGGPNTVLNLAFRVAREGIAVRLVSTVGPGAVPADWLRGHAAALLGGGAVPEVEMASAGDAAAPLAVGPGDMFLVTHWTTAQQLKPVLARMAVRRFFYMLQEFEPGFYAWSSNYARAIETFGMDFWPIVNEAVLAEFLFAQPLGRLSAPETRARAMVFEPAVDAAVFHPGPGRTGGTKRLLFYARPTNTRNMFGLGLMALRQAVADPAFDGWEFLSIGSRGSVPAAMPLGGGHVLRQGPWMDYRGYGELLRGADLLLCPMLSPHTSYPVLEMAACGGLAVTNSFATKTPAMLEALAPGIIAAEPTVEALADGLLAGARAVNAGRRRDGTLALPRDWATALDPVARRVAEIMRSGG